MININSNGLIPKIQSFRIKQNNFYIKSSATEWDRYEFQ